MELKNVWIENVWIPDFLRFSIWLSEYAIFIFLYLSSSVYFCENHFAFSVAELELFE